MPPKRFSLGVVLLSSSFGLVVAQSSGLYSPEQIDTWKLYSAFFARVRIIETLADKAEAQGKDPRRLMRATIKIEAGLTEEQDRAVRAIAADSNAAVDAVLRQRGDRVRQFKSQNPGATIAPPALSRQMADADRQSIQIVLDHVQQLKATLGDVAFQKFNGYVNTSIRPHIVNTPRPPQYKKPGEK